MSGAIVTSAVNGEDGLRILTEKKIRGGDS
jgi:hypothetical protein